MAIRPIRTFGDPVLRRPARPIGRGDRERDKALQRLIDDMIDTMRAADGVGLAAPQVGVSQRLYVAEFDEKVYVLIDPQILDRSEEMVTAEEGCLSLPGYRGAVERHARVTVRGKNRRGKTQTIMAENLLARIFQHEIDHLDGILYTDRMKPGEPLRPVEDDEDEDEPSAASGA